MQGVYGKRARARGGPQCRATGWEGPKKPPHYSPHEFKLDDYKQVHLQVIKSEQPGGGRSIALPAQGVVLMFDQPFDLQQVQANLDQLVMVLAMGGDSFLALLQLVQGAHLERPLTIHLLHSCLKNLNQTQPQQWQLLRFAVVGMKGSVFLGRLYFGNRETGEVWWDVDCRPSDGCFLAIKEEVPVYVARNVWRTYSQTLRSITEGGRELPAAEGPEPIPADPLLVVEGDYEEVKLLKRQIRVALDEEDYRLAARLRDHPLMKLYLDAHRSRVDGEESKAEQFRQQLQAMISKQRSDANRVGE